MKNIIPLAILFDIKVNNDQTLFSVFIPGYVNVKENRYIFPESPQFLRDREEFVLKNE